MSGGSKWRVALDETRRSLYTRARLPSGADAGVGKFGGRGPQVRGNLGAARLRPDIDEEEPGDPPARFASIPALISEREQLRVWSALPLRRKLEALEEMCDLAQRSLERRKRLGLPHIDPFSNALVPGSRLSGSVASECAPVEPPHKSR
jgi:hypothetical protein